ncbi:hypothetical protein [Salibacterium salarium]|uniref:hypothetical protein n=1 Tax=Salibacterium salarium TaxID=284579 RepID=UPI001639D15D|nr:hypothetical protein [Salibacterium salarium]
MNIYAGMTCGLATILQAWKTNYLDMGNSLPSAEKIIVSDGVITGSYALSS